MREYKFRAWNGETMVYPSLDGHGQINSGWIISNYETVMQFTGLKENAFESGNKDIYESDVIEFINGERLVVEWNDDTCQFQYSDGTPINNGKRYGSHKMIVGNIYESPELLK